MKYYEIKIQRFFDNDMVASNANGDRVKDCEKYFRQISEHLLEETPPIFDYFFLESFDKKKYWEWILCDVQQMTREASIIGGGGLLVSPILKEILESVELVKLHKFYESVLMYKGERLERYIFHFSGDDFWKNNLEGINFSATEFYRSDTREVMSINGGLDVYLRESSNLYKLNKTELYPKRLVLNQRLDFLYMGSIGYASIASEVLKEKIEKAGIIGFEFKELDFEVVVKEDV